MFGLKARPDGAGSARESMGLRVPRPLRSGARLGTAGLLAIGLAASLAGCALSDGTEPAAGPATASDATSASKGTVNLLTHDSFAISDAALAAFTAQTGYTVKVNAVGDAGTLANQLVLQNGAGGDVVFGIDNTFASRVLDAKVLAPYSPSAASKGANEHALPQGSDQLTAVDFSDVCVNIDHAWFADKGLTEPATLGDLTKPEYKDLLVVENPATSSPGLAFMLATVGASESNKLGSDWPTYWKALRANGVKVASSWTDAYTVDFSGSSGKGDRPLVVSYASSPPSEVPTDVTPAPTTAPTGALLDTCFRQTEYAGVLSGAANPDGAKAFVDFMLSDTFQKDLPEQMWMYPVTSGVAVPANWTAYAPLATSPWQVDPAAIEANRADWIQQWTAAVVD